LNRTCGTWWFASGDDLGRRTAATLPDVNDTDPYTDRMHRDERQRIEDRLAHFTVGDPNQPRSLVASVVIAAHTPDHNARKTVFSRPTRGDVSVDDVAAALRLIALERATMDRWALLLIDAAQQRGESLDSLAARLDLTGDAMLQEYLRVGGTPRTPAEQPAG
jgi:hypothetical protein